MAMVMGAVIDAVTGAVIKAVAGSLSAAAATTVSGGAHTVLPAREVDPDFADRMPGLGAFIVFAFLAVALYFLLKNMNARLRRMSYREKEREAAAERGSDGSGEPDAAGPASGESGEPEAAGPASGDPDPGERG